MAGNTVIFQLHYLNNLLQFVLLHNALQALDMFCNQCLPVNNQNSPSITFVTFTLVICDVYHTERFLLLLSNRRRRPFCSAQSYSFPR